MGKIKLYQIDAFTDLPFRGNPAAICILESELPEELMRSIALEMNLSETAFVRKLANGNHSLRWFTPRTEVDLCGHATLAAAHVLFNHAGHEASTVNFETRSGLLAAMKGNDGITLDFPSADPQPADLPKPIMESMGLGEGDIAATMFCRERNKFLVHLRDPDILQHIDPDFQAMLAHEPDGIIGVIITAKGYGRYDFISRFFAPWVGVNEDPVTGSAHTVLGPYWSWILGKYKMLAKQVSPRSGEMIVEVMDDRVLLTGKAVTVFETHLEI